MKQFSPLLIPLIVIVAVGCPPLPGPVSPVPAAGGAAAGDVASVCRRLGELQCEEGKEPDCTRTVTRLVSRPVIRLDHSCIVLATDRAAVRRCPGIECPEGVAP